MSETVFEAVIGLEVHIQLSNQTKMFAPESFTFGSDANHHVSEVSMAHPGALPRTNKRAIRLASKLGLALNCQINSPAFFDRKNYFYPDLPKGYQISQDSHPICGPGHVSFPMPDGSIKKIRIHHMHLEEDAGKSIHDVTDYHSMVDLNRAGAGLIEMVTQPDLKSPEEAAAFLMEIRRIVRYLNISEGNMQEGNLRCDANVSVKPLGQEKLGTRVEIKNINSFNFLSKAIQYEIDRQIQHIKDGGSITQETRTYDPVKNRTSSMRDKESADDYRYFPEPDLQPVEVSEEEQMVLKKEIVKLPSEKYQEYRGLNFAHNESMALIEEYAFSAYFDEISQLSKESKEAANWMLGSVKAWLNENGTDMNSFPIPSQHMALFIQMVKSAKVPRHLAKEQLFPAMLKEPQKSPAELATSLNLATESNEGELEKVVTSIFEAHPNEAERFRNGQKKLQGFFVGQIMKAMKGKADPKAVNKILAKMASKK
ncbi:MAG: Asp-tRNA(Asn)/Glu-tRNA(Gln) amidotransferase subunit GatB [Bacteroidota bacterium]